MVTKKRNVVVLIGGFTASGKSVLVRSLSKKLGLLLVYSSDILKQISLGVPLDEIKYKHTKMNKGWYEKSNLDKKRDVEDIDLLLDKFLLKIINKEKNLVMDSWTMPYLSKKGIKIWLKADVKERTKRVSKRGNLSYDDSLKLLKKKDAFSKKIYKKLYGFSLGKDLSVFDYVVDTNNKTIKDVEKEVIELIKNHK